ncbi:iron transporter [Ensifer adhaerens]|uniref:iron transporter n=1 Tax=Ensifer adhaerens TaxID=106592 RepID=UPI003F8400BB
MLHSRGHRTEAAAVALAREYRSVWRQCLLTLLAIAFMTAFATSHASATTADENYRVVDDLAVYLGILPAAMVRGHPKEHPETSMHDGATSGAHQYHIVVAIFDARTGARIENAGVKATVSGLGHVGTKTIELQPMAIAETITYGNFVTLLGTDRYDIQLQISVPGREHPVRVGFAYQHTR